MYILYKQTKAKNENEKPTILDAEIVPGSKIQEILQKIKNFNANDKNVERKIVEVDDNTLPAFLARDRQYDMGKFDEAVAEVKQRCESLTTTFEKLFAFYTEAREYNDQHKSED